MGRKEVNLEKLWNTWDTRAINALVFLPTSFKLSVGMFDANSKSYAKEFRREGVKSLGVHSPDCSIAEVSLQHRDSEVNILFGKEDPYVVMGKITFNKLNRSNVDIILEALNIWYKNYNIIYNYTTNFLITLYSDNDYVVSMKTDQKPDYWGIYKNSEEVRMDLEKVGHLESAEKRGKVGALQFSGEKRADINFVVAVAEDYETSLKVCNTSLTNVEDILQTKKREYEEKRVQVIGGPFEDCAQAVVQSICWNTVWDPFNSRVYTPVSRVWAQDSWNGYVVFEWDQFFNALLSSIEDLEISEANIKAILGEITPRGVVPNYASPSWRWAKAGVSSDRSEPPVGAYVVWKVYKICHDKSILKWAYPRLKRYHKWWFTARDGNKNGLLEWGSDPIGTDLFRNTRIAAIFESGLDNSPMYDEVEFERETHTINLDDVGLNSLYTLDAWALYQIAEELGLEEDAKKFQEEYSEMKDRINEILWCEDESLYLNRFWNGKFSKKKSPTCFYPLIAGIPDENRAKIMIERHLLNAEEFWGEYVIPTISRDDPAFKDNNYWRGRIWGPTNFLVYEGLKRYGFDEEAHQFAQKSASLFLKEWKEEGHYHENYNSVTGEGDDVPNSDPYYTWGSLLALLGVYELIDVEAWGGLRFGALGVSKEMTLKNFQIDGHMYSVTLSPKLTKVTRDGKVFFEASRNVVVRNYAKKFHSICFDIKGEGKTTLKISEFNPEAKIVMHVNKREEKELVSDKTGAVEFAIDLKGSQHICLKILE